MSENTDIKNLITENTIGNNEYEAVDVPNGGVYLTKYTGHDEHVIIPSCWKGKPVVGLRGTFVGNTDIKAITIPDSITSISIGTFSGCKNIKTVTRIDSESTH